MTSPLSSNTAVRREDHGSNIVQHKSFEVDEEKAIPNFSDSEENSTSKRQRRHAFLLLRNLLLLLANTIAWYITNGMNGIEMQKFSSHVEGYRGDSPETLLSSISLMLLVTALQLSFGLVLGMIILLLFSFSKPALQRNKTFSWTMTRQDVILGTLHGFGSSFTNVGFLYGGASLVQILKLMEPFETIILNKLLVPDEANITMGVVSSMVFVVGASVSLIHIRPTSPPPQAIVFAILSGITLSSRNVLQRRQHVQADAQHDEDGGKHTSKLERSVEQFAKLSYHSAVVTALLAIPLNAILLSSSSSTNHSIILKMVLVEALNWRILTWHPLYNAFSIICLAFCNALTHSLLNALKRVFAILMAVVWFKEPFNMATVLGLLAVGAGGCWYTVESKSSKSSTAATKGMTKWIKLIVSICMLQTLLRLQGMVHNNKDS